MADKAPVQVGEGSPQHVAWKLMLEISAIEGGFRDRETLLDTYAECLHATNGYRSWQDRR